MSRRITAQEKIRPGHDVPSSCSIALLRYLWPFWLFKDASRGDLYARAAAYRHNYSMRVHLPSYLKRWSIGSVLTLSIALQLADFSTPRAPRPDVFLVMASAIGMLFAVEICLLLVTAYVYLYLSRHRHSHHT